MMVNNDCGCVPVVDEGGKPVGVVTDRDIACRIVAKGKNPVDLTAADCMSSPCVTVEEDATLDDCCHALEENQIRRIVVVDRAGKCCGVIAQADVARSASERDVVEVVRKVSQPTSTPSRAGCC